LKKKKESKSPSAFGRLMEYAGRFRILTYLSMLLSAASSVMALITALHLRVGRLFCCGFWQVFMLQLVKLFLNLFTGGDVGAQEQHRA
jgi:hypothetical protein